MWLILCLAALGWIGGTAGCKDDAEKDKTSSTDTSISTDPNNSTDTTAQGEAAAGTDPVAEPDSEWPEQPEALLRALEERKQLLAQREREIARREDKVTSLELEAVAKVRELRALRDEVKKTLAELELKYRTEADKYSLQVAQKKAEIVAEEQRKVEEEKEAVLAAAEVRKKRLNQLVATLKGMRAQAGGEMLASMDEADAVEVLGMLAPRLAASLLGSMPPDKSARLAGMLIGITTPQGETQPSTDSAESPAPAPSGPAAGKKAGG